MIISVCSFGSTGSSAVSDYLSEFDNLQVLDNFEFSWVSDVDGLIDLEYHLNYPHNRTADSIVAIDRYRRKAKQSAHLFEKAGGVNPIVFHKSVEKFLESITHVKWYWDINRPNDFFGKNFRRILDRIIPRVERHLGRQVHCWPMQIVNLSVAPDNFVEAAREHVRELLLAMGADFSRPIVLDQAFAGNNPQACFKFFDDPYAIVVDRDPRDNYVFANTRLLGGNHFMATYPVEDFIHYYRALRDNQPYKQVEDRIFRVQFEDMVYNYDEATYRLRKFLSLGDNPAPRSVFNPDKSMANTQVWKRYPQFAKDIEKIESELKEYLFDFSGYPEPDKKAEMFFGKMHKN